MNVKPLNPYDILTGLHIPPISNNRNAIAKIMLHFRNMQLAEIEDLISTIRFDNDMRVW